MESTKFNKTQWKQLKKELLREKRHIWPGLRKAEKEQAFSYASRYMVFLSSAKTERESADMIARRAVDAGFIPVDQAKKGSKRILWCYKGKVAALAVLGTTPLVDGVRLIASHIDAPRLDLKQNPLYEEMEMAYLKTHYYGGIKKFHWFSRPLALHGVAMKEDGRSVDITIGEAPDDPVLVINDLLPHLAYKVQADKKVSEAFPGEKLNVIFGGIPLNGPRDASDPVKLGILRLLHERYGLREEDLVSAELEVVPAGPARDVGLDRAFVGGYAQDDKACAYASFEAITGLNRPRHTCVALFMDKEEIGSDGNTGAKSRFFELLFFDMIRLAGERLEPDTLLRVLMASRAISADVTAGIDPDYREVHEKRNDARIGHGICLTKYTGSRGKYSANDAHAEYMGWLRGVWNNAGIKWQAGELGRVDEGGGGTVAKYLAGHGLDVVDAGPPLLGMHSPFEVAHKVDLYMTCLAYRAFYEGHNGVIS